MQKLAIIIGPTAVGKTNLALKIASLVDAEIISGDSMQVYRGMDIGTAKIKSNEMFIGGRFIPHHLIDILEASDSYNVSRFQIEAKSKIAEINERHKIPLIVGGTGLYIQSIIDPYEFTEEERDEEYRLQLNTMAEAYGREHLHDMLAKIDSISAQKIHPHNLKRVIRALEVYHITGKPISFFHKVGKDYKQLYNLSFFGLNMEREALYQKIEDRVDKMISNGLVNEVSGLLAQENKPSLTALQALGYKEINTFLKDECTLPEAIAKIKLETKKFAKRQYTWFKRDQRIKWYNVTKDTNWEKIALEISLEIAG